jgi:very-short-patch-repair endonuclease
VHGELAQIAAVQDGVVSTADVERCGLSRSKLRWLTESGRLQKVAPRVFRIVGAPDTHRQRLRIGLLSLGDRSWISYEAAALLHRLDRSTSDAVEFTVIRGTGPSRAPFRLHTTSFLAPADVVTVDGLRSMSATRTVIDLAHSRASRWRVEAAIDSAVRLGLSHPTVIATRLETLRGSGRWGCRMIDRLLPDSGGHSPLERAFLRIVRSAGLDRPRTQVVHRDVDRRHVARVDFEFVDQSLVVEVTGRLGHVSDAERERDAQRRNELQDLGLTVIEYTSTQVFERTDWVGRDLLRRLS